MSSPSTEYPGHVTSDHGSEFVSHFFRSLGTALGMKLHFTSGYHPEGDGQTERVNQTLEQYLRAYCNYQQDNWSELLPLAKFAYKNAPSETTGVSPFFANKGYHLNLAIHSEWDLASNRAREFNLGELHKYLKTEMAEAQQRFRVAAERLPTLVICRPQLHPWRERLCQRKVLLHPKTYQEAS